MAKRHLWLTRPTLLIAFALLCARPAPAQNLGDSQIIQGWLSRQTNIQTWAADFTQTRRLKSLAQPLVSTGQVWFAAPANFRWELGQNHTIAIRNGENMLVVYPRLKRAERYDFAETKSEWRDTLALLQTGFPRSEQQLRAQFNILSLSLVDGLHKIQLQPKSPGARKMMPQINLFLTTNHLTLAATELLFADQSSLRNDFRNTQTNLDLSGRFQYQIPPDFKLVQPLQSP